MTTKPTFEDLKCHCRKSKAGHEHNPGKCPARSDTPPFQLTNPIKWIAHQHAYDRNRSNPFLLMRKHGAKR